jgi:hypothetical protein
MNALRLCKFRTDCLTGIGLGAMVIVADFRIVNEFNGAQLTFNIFNKSTFPASF